MRHTIVDASALELNEKVVSIMRVTKVVKGGRHMRFSAPVVVGDGNGHVGAGSGKAIEIPEAIRKGKEDAMKHIVTIVIPTPYPISSLHLPSLRWHSESLHFVRLLYIEKGR